MLRNLLICGLIAGLCGGLLATGFARVVGEGPVDQAIAFEGQQAKAAGEAEEAPLVSRTMQKSFGLLTAAVVYGLSLGGLFALAFAAIYGRVGKASPARTSILMAAGAFVVLYLVPFVKYPANPPSVGDPDTITKRTVLYLFMILISLLAAIAAVRLRGVLAERWSGTAATLAAGRCVPRRGHRGRRACCRPSRKCRRRSRRSRSSASARRRSACNSCSGRRSASSSPAPRSAS